MEIEMGLRFVVLPVSSFSFLFYLFILRPLFVF